MAESNTAMIPAIIPAIFGRPARRASAVAAAFALFVLAQAGGSNLGTPQVPGTRTPESNPGTAVASPQAATPGASSGVSSSATSPTPGAASGPGYSFGAAPAPVTSPGR